MDGDVSGDIPVQAPHRLLFVILRRQAQQTPGGNQPVPALRVHDFGVKIRAVALGLAVLEHDHADPVVVQVRVVILVFLQAVQLVAQGLDRPGDGQLVGVDVAQTELAEKQADQIPDIANALGAVVLRKDVQQAVGEIQLASQGLGRGVEAEILADLLLAILQPRRIRDREIIVRAGHLVHGEGHGEAAIGLQLRQDHVLDHCVGVLALQVVNPLIDLMDDIVHLAPPKTGPLVEKASMNSRRRVIGRLILFCLTMSSAEQ